MNNTVIYDTTTYKHELRRKSNLAQTKLFYDANPFHEIQRNLPTQSHRRHKDYPQPTCFHPVKSHTIPGYPKRRQQYNSRPNKIDS